MGTPIPERIGLREFRAQSIKRLGKAAKFATALEEFTTTTKTPPADDDDEEENSAVDMQTRTEAKAYASWMRGNLALKQNRWREAYDEYQTAMDLCESLASDSGGSGQSVDGESKEDAMRQLGKWHMGDGPSLHPVAGHGSRIPERAP